MDLWVITELPRWLRGKESACQCKRRGRCGFGLELGRSPGPRAESPGRVYSGAGPSGRVPGQSPLWAGPLGRALSSLLWNHEQVAPGPALLLCLCLCVPLHLCLGLRVSHL